MWSVLYLADDDLYCIGPYSSQGEAMQAACHAQAEGEFNVQQQHVYLLDPSHELVELNESALEAPV